VDDEGEPAAGTSRGAKVRGLRREMRRFLSGRRMVSRTPASEVAFLQGLDQAKWGKSLSISPARSERFPRQGMTRLSVGNASRELLHV